MLNEFQLAILEELSKTELPAIQQVMLKSGAVPFYIDLTSETIQIRTRAHSITNYIANLSTNKVRTLFSSEKLNTCYLLHYSTRDRDPAPVNFFTNLSITKVRKIAQAIAAKGFVAVLKDK